MIMDLLVRLGLSQKEARVYLTLLRIGTAPASSLAKRSEVKRVSVYSVLDSLEDKALVTHRDISGYRHYQALEPEQLLYPLLQKKAELSAQMEIARDCIASLTLISSSHL